MNLLERIFGQKKITCDISTINVNDVLTIDQIEKAKTFYNQHKERIDKTLHDLEKAYEPSQLEDQNNPMLWKAEYWKWFLTKQ